MMNKVLFHVAVAALVASGPALAFQFKAVNSADAPRLLPAHILVPDRSAWSGVRRVSEATTFYDHERFRVEVQPKQSGHVYLFSRNSQGEVQLLYPLRDDGDSYVSRNTRLNLPGNGWLRFDEVPGQEELILLQSPTPLADIEQAIEDESAVDSGVLDKYEEWSPRGTLIRHIFLEHEGR